MSILFAAMKLLKNACTSAKLFNAIEPSPHLLGVKSLRYLARKTDEPSADGVSGAGSKPSARMKLKSVPLLTWALPWQPMQPPMLTPPTAANAAGVGVTTFGGGTPGAITAVGAPVPRGLLEMRPWNCCSV